MCRWQRTLKAHFGAHRRAGSGGMPTSTISSHLFLTRMAAPEAAELVGENRQEAGLPASVPLPQQIRSVAPTGRCFVAPRTAGDSEIASRGELLPKVASTAAHRKLISHAIELG